jgi:hypothetical protein
MRLDLIDIVSSLEENEPLHLARLLLLLRAFIKDEQSAIEGITKLAKLDFLLRYPTYFEAALVARGVKPRKVALPEFERNTIEASMVRYKFGPWDHRYRRFLNTLAAMGLVTISITGKTISIDLTDKGSVLAGSLSQLSEFQQLTTRSDLLSRHLDMGATKLMNFIYQTFPELHKMELNDEIDARGLLNEA